MNDLRYAVVTCVRYAERMKPLAPALLLACPAILGGPTNATNVILFLADAAGVPTINAASTHGYGAPRRLFVQRMPHIALSETSTGPWQ